LGQVVEPAEQYLEYLRTTGFGANTVRAYAQGLALWWSFLERAGRAWDGVALPDFGAFLQAVRSDDLDAVVRRLRRGRARSEATVALRLRSVLAFYRYQALAGKDVAPFLYQAATGPSRRYLGLLGHLSVGGAPVRPVVRVRVPRGETPILTPPETQRLVLAEACRVDGEWLGDLRYRLLWSLLAETGMRIGEALSVQHRDWTAGHGRTASVSVADRPHPHGLSAKSGPRRIFIGSALDDLYAEYVWWLCDRGADAGIADWDSAYIFCNLHRGKQFGPLRVESVYDHLAVTKPAAKTPAAMTPHWFRHTHATALLLAGVPTHVVSRRLGHRSVQTTLDIYGHVTQDAELAALANWRSIVSSWEVPDG
jgi:integrase